MAKRSGKKQRSSAAAASSSRGSFGFPGKGILLQVALIVAAVVFIYSPALHGDWLWDDDILITKNPVVRDPYGFWKIWFQPGSLFDYFPLKVTVEWLEWQLWGNDTFGYHLLNVLLHITSALLVWRLFARLGLRLAWLGGLIFAVHPVAVESVAWIAELKNTLSLPLFLLSACAWVDYDARGRRNDYLTALGFFVAAMLCKTTMVMFPFVILLYVWWRRGRIRLADLKTSAPFFAVSLVLGLITIWFLRNHAIGHHEAPLAGALSRIALAGLSLAFYFSKCFWPVGLLPMYPKWPVDPPSPFQFLPWLVLIGLIAWFVATRKTWGKNLLLGLGFFVINLLPFIGFIAASYMNFTWVMDHLLYLPMIGLIGLAVAGLGQIETRLPAANRSVLVGAVLVLAALLAWQSRGYAKLYVDYKTMALYTLERYPDAWLMRNNYGISLVKLGQIPQGMEQIEKSIETNPRYAVSHYNLGFILRNNGRFDEAIAQFELALKIDPDYVEARSNLGAALAQANRISEAIDQFNQILQRHSDFFDARKNLAAALFQTGHDAESIEQYEKAVKIDPNQPEVRGELGTVYFHAGDLSRAIEQYDQALRLDPNNSMNHFNLGTALLQNGQIPGALDQFEQAVKLDPGNAAIQANFGAALTRAGRIPEAIEHLQQALKLDPSQTEARKNLAALQSLPKTGPARN